MDLADFSFRLTVILVCDTDLLYNITVVRTDAPPTEPPDIAERIKYALERSFLFETVRR